MEQGAGPSADRINLAAKVLRNNSPAPVDLCHQYKWRHALQGTPPRKRLPLDSKKRDRLLKINRSIQRAIALVRPQVRINRRLFK